LNIFVINKVTGDCQRYDSFDEDNFTQCGIFFRDVLNEEEKERLVDNIAAHIKDAQGFLQDRAVKNFGSADQTFGKMLRKRIDFYKDLGSSSSSGTVASMI